LEGTYTTLQVKHLIAEIRQIAKQTFPKSIEIQIDISPNLWTVSGDATQLHQVLMNLVVNARDAMPNGGKLTISAENFTVDEHYARMNLEAKVGSYVVISVADEGLGMSPETQERIFEPFFTTKELGKGTGLGLSTVMGIVKGHGGFIHVWSEVGRGTEFQIYLPAVAVVEYNRQTEQDTPYGNGELILVVDDEAGVREATKTSLETFNYKVLTANDGIEAIATYAENRARIQLVLVDMLMPAMDGITTIRTLQKLNPQIKAIATSGLASKDHLNGMADTEVQAFLAKPYTAQELLQTIKQVLCSQPVIPI
jgi:CheY-like chemotaxis protein